MGTWYERGVFYHIYPLGMTGAPKHNDPVKVTGRSKELLQWISHIKSLGCNAIYIGSLFEPTNHGYDTRDHKLVDHRLGDNQAFKNFVKQCHDPGIKVVAGGVFNHMGRESFVFKDIQEKRRDPFYRDWYRRVSFGWQSPCGDSFRYEAWQGHFELPCLNLPNPEVRSYLFDVIRFRVDEFDIDGIWLSCANVLDFNFTKEMRSVTSGMRDDFWLMGEVIHGDYSRWANQEMFHSVTNYEFHKNLYSGLNDHNFFEIAYNVRRLETIGRQLYTFVNNHDEDRIASKLVSKEHLFPIYPCLSTLPGIPSIYYGGEWGVEGKGSNTSNEALRPALSIDQVDELHRELTDFLSTIGCIHDGSQEFYDGRYQELLLTNRQYVFVRHGGGSVITTAADNDDSEAELDIPVPIQVSETISLLEEDTILPTTGGEVHAKLKDNWGAVLRIRGDKWYSS